MKVSKTKNRLKTGFKQTKAGFPKNPTLWLWLISFASVVTYEQVVTYDNLNNQIIKLLMFLIWLIENWNHK